MFASFDHLSGNREQLIWNSEAECLRGREINDQIKFCGLLYRDIGGFRAAQNFVHQLSRAPEQVREVWSVGQETSDFNKTAVIEDRWKSRS